MVKFTIMAHLSILHLIASPRFCQIYIFDTERASLERGEKARSYNLNSHLLMLLHSVLIEHNQLASMFYTKSQLREEKNQRAAMQNISSRQVFMHIRSDRTDDRRRYNAATANDIAAVFTSEDGTPPSCLKYEIV